MSTTVPEMDVTDRLLIAGVEGLLLNEELTIALGQSVIIGRSRRCHLSMRRSRAFRLSDEKEQRRILFDKAFLKVSRRHIRISWLAPDEVEIWDLSKNGTWVNGNRIDRIVMRNLDRPVRVRLADSEELVLARAPAPVRAA
jgi:pSer/pThr/pTyr-binding forkhead associated (FHA) protein